MNISIIGSGNVATVFSILAKNNGHFIHQIIARNETQGEILANKIGTSYCALNNNFDKAVDLFIVALSDNAFSTALKNIDFGETPVFHTAGSVSMHVLEDNTKHYGVIYPLQSLRKEMEIIPTIPLLLEAKNEQTLHLINSFAKTISNDVIEVSEDKRLRLHASAVLVSNFTNYLYGVAETFCKNENVDFNLLKPLILETANRIQTNSPLDVQTGPAIRKDITTLEKHLRLFSTYPKLKTLYTRMTDSIIDG